MAKSNRRLLHTVIIAETKEDAIKKVKGENNVIEIIKVEPVISFRILAHIEVK